ncbi:MAG: 23S rRNA (adenine(2503)-C(2))-methyltransferase RlmN [Candidatus Sumerlaeaceae bacterium]|nr:23S rRNA (adenine(2503)-C(2))-methyltransferase RlmN [Candidatus Sumerlaeaceae bacterium]
MTHLPQRSNGRYVLLGSGLNELRGLVQVAGMPAFRAKQLFHWMYHRAALSFEEMHNISRDFQKWLAENCVLGYMEIADVRESADGSRKIVFRLSDGRFVESVLIKEDEWFTLCISTQVGCAVGCTFCMTGFGGFQRNMTRAEIVAQVLLVKRAIHGELPRNVVLMGMGEPLLNLGEVVPALRVMVDPEGMAIAARRVTVSTSGIIPGIKRLGEEDLGVSLAISLNATTDAVRDVIMPINKAYPIAELLQACREFPLRPRRRITFEYVLLKDINDSLEDAQRLAKLLRGIPCKINLIPFNPDENLPFERPPEERILAFQDFLFRKNYTAIIRYSKGLDVGAACGQLAAHWRESTRKDA